MNIDVQKLVGKKICKIFMDDEYLKFETDQGDVVFGVEGDCCSRSYFHDFIGVKKLLDNGAIISAKEIDLGREDLGSMEERKCYGFELVTKHPEFGEQTSVFSFRNDSNGYYGGSLIESSSDQMVLPEVFNDVIEAATRHKK